MLSVRHRIWYNTGGGYFSQAISSLHNEIRRSVSWQIKNKRRCKKLHQNQTNRRKKLNERKKLLNLALAFHLKKSNIFIQTIPAKREHKKLLPGLPGFNYSQQFSLSLPHPSPSPLSSTIPGFPLCIFRLLQIEVPLFPFSYVILREASISLALYKHCCQA